MKTAEELFKMYAVFKAGENKCMDYCFFNKALTEHDAEIKALIDGMIERNVNKMENDKPASILQMARWQEQIDVLTELKEKL